MDYEKIIIGLALVLAGWFLAQFTDLFKNFYNTNKVKKCLLEELEELKSELERTLLIFSRQLQIYALKGIDNGNPVQLSNYIFSNYYKDAVFVLTNSKEFHINSFIPSWQMLILG